MTDLTQHERRYDQPYQTGALRMPDERYDHIIKFADIKKVDASALPPLVDSDALRSVASQLQLLGNDEAGDCEAVRWANNRFLVTSALTDTPHYPSQEDVWKVYQTQNPGFVPGHGPHGYGSADDQGMDSDKLAAYLVNHGGPDGVKAVAYAAVDPTNLADVELAINTFGSVWVDIVVLDANQEQFARGLPWTNTAGKIDGGHAVLGGGVTIHPTAASSSFVDIATWAAEASLSESFWSGSVQGQALVMGVYAVIWPEHLGTRHFEQNISLVDLMNAYQAATGKTLVSPPIPVPNPTPSPAPRDALSVFLATPGLADWARARHTGTAAKIAKAIVTLQENS